MLRFYTNTFCLNNILDELDKITDSISDFDYTSKRNYPKWVKENDNYVLRLDLPGYNKNEIDITYLDKKITIVANNELRGETKYKISTPLKEINETFNAKLADGVLSISFPVPSELKPTERKLLIE